jgi:predicted DNA-binding protein (UPF0251 family)
MSPRKTVLRKISSPPKIKGFKPYGDGVLTDSVEKIMLQIEEYEAIKMCDYDQYTHCEASQMMGVSRPTFTRIYSIARQKTAKAMVEGLQICIEGGKIYFDSDWYQCQSCPAIFNNSQMEEDPMTCPICGLKQIERLENGFANNIENHLTHCRKSKKRNL